MDRMGRVAELPRVPISARHTSLTNRGSNRKEEPPGWEGLFVS
jgi:hypothetical protein